MSPLCVLPLLAYVGADAVTAAALVIVYSLILYCFFFFFNWVTAIDRTVGRISQAQPAPDCSLIKYSCRAKGVIGELPVLLFFLTDIMIRNVPMKLST